MNRESIIFRINAIRDFKTKQITEKEKPLIRQIIQGFRIDLRNAFRRDPMVRKVSIANQVKTMAENGFVVLFVDSTDCDHYRVKTAWQYQAIPSHIMRTIDEIYNNAEGPTYVEIGRPSDFEDYETEYRDYALEAFEDGHSHCIYR